MARNRYARQSLGSLHATLKSARVLLVGAGGIGCELLKNLVLTEFGEVVIVDLDTVDFSNLNRQFLFRREHVKKAKALVAKESAQRFNREVKIHAHHADIKDSQFNVDWFQSFSIVFNALDNLSARRHVNRMCLAADVPLIESGTTGLNGQVQVIKKGRSECYDCNIKEPPKTYPVCTIRSTPSQPIHCIVWAKSYLFPELFGTSEEDAADLDRDAAADEQQEVEKLKQESQALQRIARHMDFDNFVEKVFRKVYEEDIERLRSMEDVWKNRRPPEILDFSDLSKAAKKTDLAGLRNQATWSVAESFAVFEKSLRLLGGRLQSLRARQVNGENPPSLIFDKDDEDALDLVTASANLRSSVFGIDLKSKFDVKQMAGSIIPAIATTNAMVAGLCVLQALNVIRADYDKAKTTFLANSIDRVLSSEPLRPPHPTCVVCSVAQEKLTVDTGRATVGNLVSFLRSKLEYGDELSISSTEGVIYDPELEDNLTKKFADLGIVGNTFLTIVDEEEEEPHVDLSVFISHKNLPQDADPVDAPNGIKVKRKPAKSPAVLTNGTNGEVSRPSEQLTGKRKRDTDEVVETYLNYEAKKKRGTAVAEIAIRGVSSATPFLIDESNEGAIVLDDT